MACIRFQQQSKVIPLGKFDKEGTSVMKKATNISLRVDDVPANNYSPNANLLASMQQTIGGAEVTLTVLQYYVGPNDAEGNPTYGSPMTGMGQLGSYQTSIRAVGEDFVKVMFTDETKTVIDLQHPECGIFLKEARNATIEDAEAGGILDCDYMYDNEFFRRVAYNNTVIVMPIVERFIMGHKLRGKFAL